MKMPVSLDSLRAFLPSLLIIIVAVVGYLLVQRKKSGSSRLFSGSSTPTLDAHATDFTQLADQKHIDPVIGRQKEVSRVARVLSRRNKNNVILVGAPGVGKTAIVEGLAQRIIQKDIPDQLMNKRLLSLDVGTLLSGTKYRGEFESRLKKIIKEIEVANRSIILFVDEIHSIVQSEGAKGAINFADMIKPALARGELQMIGATTIDEYKTYILSNPSLERRFQPIEVVEPTVDEAVKILKGIKDKYREYHRVEFTDAALEEAVVLTKKFIAERKLPDKAIDALDEAAAMTKVSHVHESVPAVLYKTAVEKHPQVAKLWKKIQALDTKIVSSKNKRSAKTFTKSREALEETISKKGVIVVDSKDVKDVVLNWTHTFT